MLTRPLPLMFGPRGGGRLRPALDLNFLAGGSLDSRITFTRVSAATYFDANGVMQVAAAGVPRFNYDPLTLKPRGLLMEQQATNLLLNSATLSTQSVTVAAQTYTLSFYGSGSVTLSGAATGTLSSAGAYPARAALTFTATTGTLTLAVSGAMQFAQLEAGSFATSWIPTAGTAAARSADVGSMALSSIPGWNGSAGTLVVESDQSTTGIVNGTMVAAEIGDGSNSNLIQIATQFNSTNFQTLVNAGGVAQAVFLEGALTAKVRRAIAFAVNDFAACRDGGAVSTDTAGTIPSASTLFIGNRSGVGQINGHIGFVRLYGARLPNAIIQGMTAP